MNKINTVVFDVGWVLVHLDFLRHAIQHAGHGATRSELRALGVSC